MNEQWLIAKSENILITGANGFIGMKVVEALVDFGFEKIRCLVRSDSNLDKLKKIASKTKAEIEILRGTLFSREDCEKAIKGVAVVYHLAVGSSGKSFPNAFMNAVLPTRNLLDACTQEPALRRFVNISSFAIYSNQNKPEKSILDEHCPIELHPQKRGDAYAYAKLKQDQIVMKYAEQFGIKYVMLRPGAVYGPGNDSITGRVGIDTFGIFMHLGGNNPIPFTYVDNCADAIARAGFVEGIEGEIINIVDDDLPTSREFLIQYKKNVKSFPPYSFLR